MRTGKPLGQWQAVKVPEPQPAVGRFHPVGRQRHRDNRRNVDEKLGESADLHALAALQRGVDRAVSEGGEKAIDRDLTA